MDEPEQTSDEPSPGYRQIAVRHLEAAGQQDNGYREVNALIGIGYALLANGEDAEAFYSMFAGEEGRATVEAWVNR